MTFRSFFIFSLRCFEESHKNWWAKFLDDKDNIFKHPDKGQTWILDDIVAIKQRQRREVHVEVMFYECI